MQDLVDFLKTSWVPYLAVLLLAGFVVVKATKFSITDFIAEKAAVKAIEKIDANYTPFGPTQPKSGAR